MAARLRTSLRIGLFACCLTFAPAVGAAQDSPERPDEVEGAPTEIDPPVDDESDPPRGNDRTDRETGRAGQEQPTQSTTSSGTRMAAQIGVGTATAVLGAIAGGIGGLAISSPIWLAMLASDDESADEGAIIVSVFSAGIGALLGTPIGAAPGVQKMGDALGGNGTFLGAAAGAAVGTAVGIPVVSGLSMLGSTAQGYSEFGTALLIGSPVVFLVFSAVGATFGYRLSSSPPSDRSATFEPSIQASPRTPGGDENSVTFGLSGRF